MNRPRLAVVHVATVPGGLDGPASCLRWRRRPGPASAYPMIDSQLRRKSRYLMEPAVIQVRSGFGCARVAVRGVCAIDKLLWHVCGTQRAAKAAKPSVTCYFVSQEFSLLRAVSCAHVP